MLTYPCHVPAQLWLIKLRRSNAIRVLHQCATDVFAKSHETVPSPAIPPFVSAPLASLRLARLAGVQPHSAPLNSRAPAAWEERNARSHRQLPKPTIGTKRTRFWLSHIAISRGSAAAATGSRLTGGRPAVGPPAQRGTGTCRRAPLRSPERGPAAAAAATGSRSVRPQRGHGFARADSEARKRRRPGQPPERGRTGPNGARDRSAGDNKRACRARSRAVVM